jgi:hypothetical protein
MRTITKDFLFYEQLTCSTSNKKTFSPNTVRHCKNNQQQLYARKYLSTDDEYIQVADFPLNLYSSNKSIKGNKSSMSKNVEFCFISSYSGWA